MKSTYILFIILFTLLIVACAGEQQSTINNQQSTDNSAATAVIPTFPPEPTVTAVPPTTTPSPTDTPAPPTATPEPTATAVPNTLNAPERIQPGDELVINGTWNVETAVSLALTIHINDWLLAEGETGVNEDGSWEIAFPLPPQISGVATIDLFAEDTAVPALSTQLIIQPNMDGSSTYVTLNSPVVGETAVAGYAMFFHGIINRPIRRTLVMGILHDGCSRFAAKQTFELGNGNWEGFTVLPSDITLGPACAIARTGDPDDGDEWVAAMVPITIYAPDDEAATNIRLGNPGELIFVRGEMVLLYGTAVNAPNNEVDILLNSDDGTFRLLAEETVSVNSYGYWELEILLPDNYNGFALLTISMGSGDTYHERRIPVIITK